MKPFSIATRSPFRATGLSVALAVTICALASCSGDGAAANGPETAESTTVQGDGSAADATQEGTADLVEDLAPASFSPSAGPLLVDCVASASGSGPVVSVLQLDLGTGASAEVFRATLPAGLDDTFGVCYRTFHLEGWTGERFFDREYRRLAVSWETEDGDRVGWITNTGQLVDVTDRVPAHGGDVGTAQFDPDGNFVYVDYGTATLHRVDPDSLAAVGSGDAVSITSTVDQQVLLPGGTTASVYVMQDSAASVSFTVPGGTTFTSAAGGSVADVTAHGSALVIELDYSTILFSLRLASPSDAATATSDLPLLVQLDGQALDAAVVGGAGTHAVYEIVGVDAADSGFYQVALDGSGSATRVADLVPDYSLLSWPDAP